MTTKNMLTVLLVLVLGSPVLFAQKHSRKFDPQDKIDARLNTMDAVVKFNGNQRNDVQALFTQSMQKRRDAFCANETGSESMKNAMKNIRRETQDGLKKILSNNQMKLWKDYKKQQKKEHPHKGSKGKGGKHAGLDSRLDKMDAVVKFTGTQRDQMKVLLTDIEKRTKDAACANEPGSDGFKNAMKSIHTDKKAGMEKILTKDQMDLWKAHRKEKGKEHHPDDGINK